MKQRFLLLYDVKYMIMVEKPYKSEMRYYSDVCV